MPRERLDAETIRMWQRIIRDFATIGLGVFLFVFGTLMVNDPGILALMYGAGATLLGLPAALRWDERNNGEK